MTAEPVDVDALSFEDALARLDSIVSTLERGDVQLEESIAKFELGMKLARRCEDRLNESERKVALLLREGPALVEVDLETGRTLGRMEDQGVDPFDPATSRPATPPPHDDDIPF
jgi:exodeoxyribonuclease VII small subunit